MTHWTDELHGILLQIANMMNRPDVDAQFVKRAGVKLDGALYPLLSRIGAAGAIGTVQLAEQVGRDHSTVSRQVAKLEELGLVEREASASDGRVRMLRPTRAGRRMIEKFAQTRRTLMESHFSEWSETEIKQLLRLLRKAAQRPEI